MEYLKIALTALFSIIELFLLTKLMGNRQMSQLTMFDYIIGITIGSIAAEMATELDDTFLRGAIAMAVYALISFLISLITEHSVVLRRFFTGRAVVLYQNGSLYRNNFKHARIDLNEFLTLMRNEGYFNLADIYSAVMESNGKISFLPLSSKRPLTPEDMNLSPDEACLVYDVIIDGKILRENLKMLGLDEIWLKKQLKAQSAPKITEIFLATCDRDNNLSVYGKKSGKTGDVFQ